MNWKALTIAATLLASAFHSQGAPVTFKEISMLLRNGEQQQFIFSEAETRKLLQPLSKQEEAALSALGATPALLNALRSPTLLAPPEAVAAYNARLQRIQESSHPGSQAAPQQEAPRGAAVEPPLPTRTAPSVISAVAAAKDAAPMALFTDSAFSLSQIEDAKAKAWAEKKPLGFVMVWGQFFGKKADPRGKGSVSALAHFYRAFGSSLVLVFVRHESELRDVPDAVQQGFSGPDEGGFAPNMAVVDATASQFIVEIPMGGANGEGPKRDEIFAAGAAKIDQWLAAHPNATASTP
jgi:hypothetical protein